MPDFLPTVPLHEVIVEEEIGPRQRENQHQNGQRFQVLRADEVV